MMSPKRDPYRESDKRGLFLQEFVRVLYEKKKNSLVSVLLALLTFLGVVQVQNLSKILEDIMYNKSKHGLTTKTYKGLRQSG